MVEKKYNCLSEETIHLLTADNLNYLTVSFEKDEEIYKGKEIRVFVKEREIDSEDWKERGEENRSIEFDFYHGVIYDYVVFRRFKKEKSSDFFFISCDCQNYLYVNGINEDFKRIIGRFCFISFFSILFWFYFFLKKKVIEIYQIIEELNEKFKNSMKKIINK